MRILKSQQIVHYQRRSTMQHFINSHFLLAMFITLQASFANGLMAHPCIPRWELTTMPYCPFVKSSPRGDINTELLKATMYVTNPQAMVMAMA